VLAREAESRFADAIARGRLTVLNIGLGKEFGRLPFYCNDSNDHWSSFHRHAGARAGSHFHVVEVETAPLSHFFERFGTPYYLKIDIEGDDQLVLEQLAQLPMRPQFVSFETATTEPLWLAHAAGYRHFQLLPQHDKSWAIPPFPPREGAYVTRKFSGRDSGLFGEELPFQWIDAEEAAVRLAHWLKSEAAAPDPMARWIDVHARL
jgi:FkbM family methyltransferase